jgi:hypothetical protein
MALQVYKIATIEVGSGGSSTIDFTSIPSGYTNLVLDLSSRDTLTSTQYEVFARFNNISTSVYTYNRMVSDASTGTSAGGSDTKLFIGNHPGSGATASTFSNISITIPNYTSSINKLVSVDAISSNNASTNYLIFTAGVTSETAAINRITLSCNGNFTQYSMATLYGIL